MTPPGPSPQPLPPHTGPAGEHPIIFFDGLCGFCDASVRFVMRRDRRRLFRYCPLQAEPARRLLGEEAAGELRSVALLDAGRVYRRSEAALRILRRLGPPWSAAYAAMLIPAPLRDAVYDLVARNRYRLSGKNAACRVPTPEERGLFLTDASWGEPRPAPDRPA